MNNIVNQLNAATTYLAKEQGKKELLQKELSDCQVNLTSTQSNIELFEKTKIFLQELSETAREVAKNRIETVVTKALQYVFGMQYSFKIELKNTASRVEADFLVLTQYGDKVIKNYPTTGKGGGIVDLLAIALKFSVLELVNFDGPIWLDEPFKHVSEDYIPAAGRLLTYMGEMSGRQITIITHNPRLAEMCNKIIHVAQKDGKSSIS